MDEELADRISALLGSSGGALSAADIAEQLKTSASDVEEAIWGRPGVFAWQPGHRWSLTTEKMSAAARPVPDQADDARQAPFAGSPAVALRAMTLASGVTLRVSQRPMDTMALLTTSSCGSELELVINSAHPVFAHHPMPFGEASDESGFKALIEVLLEAWALYEDSAHSNADRRRLEDVRLMWGRQLARLLSEDV